MATCPTSYTPDIGVQLEDPEAFAELEALGVRLVPIVGRYLAQIPEERLDTVLPGRPRSYRQLVYHVFNIPEVFLDHVENDAPYLGCPVARAESRDAIGYLFQS